MASSSRNGTAALGNGRGLRQNGNGRGERKGPGSRWPGWHQPKTKSALLCSTATPADRLAVDYAGPLTQLRLQAGDLPLLASDWNATLTRGGVSADVAGNWELGLWHADADCDYLELSCVVAGVRIDRHFLLSRTEQFAFLADAVQGSPGVSLRYQSQFSTAAGLAGQAVSGSTEIRLKRGRSTVARLFPLAVPQEGTPHRRTALTAGEGTLSLQQETGRGSLLAPLLIDWNPERRTAAADWRSLTVTEEEEIVGPERAVGLRIRIGSWHVLIYRSLQSTADTRCVLGMHTRYETSIAHFLPTGEIRQIMATLPDNA